MVNSRVIFCDCGNISEREMEQLFRTGDVSRAIGHPKNSSVVSSACKNLDLPEPLGLHEFPYVEKNICGVRIKSPRN